MEEIWKDIENYEGLYQVSNKRRIKSLNYNHTGKERIMKQQKTKDGYLRVGLCKDGEYKHCLVHRLVAKAFIPNAEKLPQVNHKDENKQNNCVDNLEWCTEQYNNTYGNRINKISRPVICVETGEIFGSYKEAQEKTGIFANNIGCCARHKKHYYTARRYHWEYLNKE